MPTKKAPANERDDRRREKAALEKIFQIILELSGVDFAHYRQTTIRRRLRRYLALGGHKTYLAFSRHLERHPEEVDALCDHLLLSFTEFFRETKMFDALKKNVFPVVVKKRSPKEPIRFWIPGCSTGEEVYSIAIAFAEFAEEAGVKAPVQFFGTDLVERHVEKARAACYTEAIRRRVSPARIERFFDFAPDGYRVAKQIREMCVFARQDITADPPFSNIDLVSCRNVLIYFDTAYQERVLPLFHFALKPHGFLVLGSSETTGRFPRLFGTVDKKHRIYSKRTSRSRPRYEFVSYSSSGRARGAATAATAGGDRPSSKADLGQLIDRVLLDTCVPPGVLVDGAMNIRRYVGRTGSFLEAASGEASLRLTGMAREGLMPDIYLAIEDAKRLSGPSPKRRVSFRSGRKSMVTEIRAIPIADPGLEEPLFLVLFEEDGVADAARASGRAAAPSRDRTKDAEIARLKSELQETKQHLQHIIEEKEEVNQELWAANEEVQSTNEELQSINEEMEAAKEELESSNEELVTLNEELLEKNLELMQAKELTESIINSSLDGIVAFDADLRYTVWNPGMEAISGQSAEAVLGRRSFELFPGLTETPEGQGMRRALVGEPSIARDRPYLVPQTGKRGFVEGHFGPLRDAAGEIVGGLAIIRETTEHKLAEEALRESEQRYRKLIDASPIGVFIVGAADRRGRYANPAFLTLFGYRVEDVQRLRVDDLHPAESFPVVLGHFADIAAGREKVAPELECLRADGTAFFADVSAVPVELGGEACIVGMFSDVTERKSAEDRRIEMERRLMHAQKLESLGVLAGGIAHDFNNLLTAIMGNLDLSLHDIDGDSPVRSSLEQAMQATNSAAGLTKQILAYSGRARFVLGSVDLGEIVTRCSDLLRSSVERTAALELRSSSGLPLIEADPEQIQQVILNLVTNASEALRSEPGTIKVETGVEECDGARLGLSCIEEKPEPGRFAFVEVSDTGEGMDATARKRLFEPFFTTKFTGRGLGMSVVIGIVRSHKGAIFVHSELGRGTSVRVLFPVSEGEGPGGGEGATIEATRSRIGPGHGAPTVLIVDDEAPVRRLGAAFAARLGYRAVTAADGEEALEIFGRRSREFDCVILDLTMPRMDGFRAFLEMKRIDPDVRVILSSGYNEEHATSLFGGAGLAGFMEKPYRLGAFEEKIEAVLRGSR